MICRKPNSSLKSLLLGIYLYFIVFTHEEFIETYNKGVDINESCEVVGILGNDLAELVRSSMF